MASHSDLLGWIEMIKLYWMIKRALALIRFGGVFSSALLTIFLSNHNGRLWLFWWSLDIWPIQIYALKASNDVIYVKMYKVNNIYS